MLRSNAYVRDMRQEWKVGTNAFVEGSVIGTMIADVKYVPLSSVTEVLANGSVGVKSTEVLWPDIRTPECFVHVVDETHSDDRETVVV